MRAAIDIGDSAKPTLVMVHGMSGDHRVFDAQVDAFRDRFRILLIDLPGHGLSSGIDGPFGHAEFADHVQSVMAERGVTTAHYWGTHTGATVGVLLAAQRPEQFTSLILEGPLLPGNNPQIVVDTINRAKTVALAEGLEKARDVWWLESCWFDMMRQDPVRCRADAHRHIIDDFDGAPWLDFRTPAPVASVVSRLPGIMCPALIYNGAADHPQFLTAAGEIQSALPNARRVTIPHTGGFPAWESPEEVNTLVTGFLRGTIE